MSACMFSVRAATCIHHIELDAICSPNEIAGGPYWDPQCIPQIDLSLMMQVLVSAFIFPILLA